MVGNYSVSKCSYYYDHFTTILPLPTKFYCQFYIIPDIKGSHYNEKTYHSSNFFPAILVFFLT